MKKKGMTTWHWVAIGALVLMLLVLYAGPGTFLGKLYHASKSILGIFGVGGDSDKENTKESNSALAFSNFIALYENCVEFEPKNCICDQFDLSDLPKDYSIRLENIGSNTRIELYSSKPAPEKVVVKDFTNFCIYQYDRSTGAFLKSDIDNILLNSEPLSTGFFSPRDTSGIYKINNKVQLFRIDRENICIVTGTYESKGFDEITRLYQKCSLKAASVQSKAGILDISDFKGDYPKYPEVSSSPVIKNEESSKIIEQLRNLLLENVGKVTRITEFLSSSQDRRERRQNMFKAAYSNFDSNGDSLINDDAYIISIRSIQLKLEDSEVPKDYFRIHYLQGSAKSKILAEKIGAKLQEINEKLIYNDAVVSKAEANERYRLDFQVLFEENSKDRNGPVFLACIEDYKDFIACKENTLIPAVFIDIVEVDGNGHYIIEGHQSTIARKIYEGIKEYLEK